MPKRPLSEQVDEAVQAMLVWLQPRPEEKPDRNLPALTAIARELRLLPRVEFREALRSDLQRRITMNEGPAASGTASVPAVHYLRPGLTSITTCIIMNKAAEFIEFLKAAFGGVEKLRVPTPDGRIMHAEVAIGNGAVEGRGGSEQFPAAPTEIHLYVDDADATYTRALQAGATSIYAPTDDHPSGDRWGTLQDQFGNRWHIATPKGWTPGPEGLRSIQPYLHLRDAQKRIPFLEAAS